MPIVAQGGTVTLRANVGHSNGSPADDPALTLTILDTPGDPVAGFPVAIPPIVRDDLGAYHYIWTVPVDLAVGDYTATWDATVDSADAGGSEQVEVVEPGAVTSYALLTLAECRAFPGMPPVTVLSDESLLILLDAAAQAIVREHGLSGETTERLRANGDLLMLSRPALIIATVVEDARRAALTLAADDYELSASGQTLYRLHDGTNPAYYWRGRVDITYTPFDDTAERQRVQRELVMLDIAHQPGLASQSIGTWSESYATSGKSYAEQRQDILASLNGGGWIV